MVYLLFDTAPSYGGMRSSNQTGILNTNTRGDVSLSTKWGYTP
jgi:aryl-alcohol dehydrogenase-like predicted oxidoreductase